jgi:hypothetical protein
VTSAAPRIDGRLAAAIADYDRRDRPIAETNRRVGELAERLGLPRPSYEQVRFLTHAARNGRRVYGAAEAALDLSLRTRSPEAVVGTLMNASRSGRASNSLLLACRPRA